MKLQSMLEFVLEQKQIYISDRETPANIGLHNYLKYTSNYANFLKQELTLGMFVPVDEKGNVLEEPKWANCKGDRDFKNKMAVYNEAKSKVYFEGFFLNEDSLGKYVENNYSDFVYVHNMPKRTIEDLTNCYISLTDHAKSLIF